MKPLRYTVQSNPIYLDDIDFEKDYKLEKCYNFVPEIIENIYDGGNKYSLLAQNTTLISYNQNKDKYKYIGTRNTSQTEFIEFFIDTESNDLLEYLVDNPKGKKYYPSLSAVAVFKKVNIVC